jgi:hypothetical protein
MEECRWKLMLITGLQVSKIWAIRVGLIIAIFYYKNFFFEYIENYVVLFVEM